MKKLTLALFFLLLCQGTFSQEKTEKMDWDGLPVLWLSEPYFPTYDVVFYFADGALGDQVSGETDTMFNLLASGTRRFEQKDISDHLEYYGVGYSSEVTPEYSLFHVSGLMKDLKPTMKMICHLFSDATFPDEELKRFKNIRKDRLNNITSSLDALGSRAFRAVSMEGTPFSAPMGGRLKDVDHWNSKALKEKLHYMNSKVSKKIYLSGPSSVLELKDIITRECPWKKTANFVRNVEMSDKLIQKKEVIYLVTVPQATQAYIYMGRVLLKKEIQNLEMLELLSSFLGGGFSSKLMQEIRVKRGLSYGAEASLSGQRNYGRFILSTYTKNESVLETIKVIRSTLDDIMDNKFEGKEFVTAKEGLVGSYPFRFEKGTAYLTQLVYFDHIGKNPEELYRFPTSLGNLKQSEMVEMAKNIFPKSNLTLTVIGSKDLAEKLRPLGEVKIVPYTDFL